MHLQSAIEHLQLWAAKQPSITAVYLHGSRLTGTHRLDSDLDIAIQLRGPKWDQNRLSIQLADEHSRTLSEMIGHRIHMVFINVTRDICWARFWRTESKLIYSGPGASNNTKPAA